MAMQIRHIKGYKYVLGILHLCFWLCRFQPANTSVHSTSFCLIELIQQIHAMLQWQDCRQSFSTSRGARAVVLCGWQQRRGHVWGECMRCHQ